MQVSFDLPVFVPAGRGAFPAFSSTVNTRLMAKLKGALVSSVGVRKMGKNA
jgi:hypothetical protein